MSRPDRKKRITSLAVSEVESLIASQLPPNRRQEFEDYLKLFGYREERTILQVYIPGFFRKRNDTAGESKKRAALAKRYGGTTFVIVGKTHDPVIIELVNKPRKSADNRSSGYIGYLWKGRSKQGEAPHQLLPIDFTPAQLRYPDDWKQMFATKGFIVGMHVPASFASKKNALSRALYREGKAADPKREWSFIESLKGYGYHLTTGEASSQKGPAEGIAE